MGKAGTRRNSDAPRGGPDDKYHDRVELFLPWVIGPVMLSEARWSAWRIIWRSRSTPTSFLLFGKHYATRRMRRTTVGIGALRLRWPLPSGAATSAQGDRSEDFTWSRSQYPGRMMKYRFVGLVGAVDDQDHAGAQGCDILVVVLQGGNRRVVGVCDRRQGLAALDLVMPHGGMGACRCGLGCGVTF